MIQLLILFAQKFAFAFESFPFAENFEIALKAVVENIPQFFAFGGEVEGLEASLDVFCVHETSHGVF